MNMQKEQKIVTFIVALAVILAAITTLPIGDSRPVLPSDMYHK